MRNAIIEDEEAEEADVNNSRAAGRPNNYSFDGFESTKHLTSSSSGTMRFSDMF